MQIGCCISFLFFFQVTQLDVLGFCFVHWREKDNSVILKAKKDDIIKYEGVLISSYSRDEKGSAVNKNESAKITPKKTALCD